MTSLTEWCKENKDKAYLLDEWNYEKNKITPDDISYGSKKKIAWKCKKGHDWIATLNSRASSLGNNCPYCSNKIVLKGYNDLATTDKELLAEWSYKKNKIKPTDLTSGSNKKVWWVCKEKHMWQTSPTNRMRGSGCPYCCNKKVLKGYNDLATTYSEILDEWDYTKNIVLPTEVTKSSLKKVYWLCKKCGHSWEASLANRTSGSGCPKCNQSNVVSFGEKAVYFYISKYLNVEVLENIKIPKTRFDLDIFIPSMQIGIEFDGPTHKKERDLRKNKICFERGIKLIRLRDTSLSILNTTSIDYIVGCCDWKELNKVIYQILKNEFSIMENLDIDIQRDNVYIDALITYTKTKNSVEELIPELLKEWDYNKNSIKPNQVTIGSHKKVYWLCGNGHSWKAQVKMRTKGTGCPYCTNQKVLMGFNDLATNYPQLLNEWDYIKNSKNNVYPEKVTKWGHTKVWWKCSKGHEWQTEIYSRSKLNTGCPYCRGRQAIKGETDLATTNPEILSDWSHDKNTIKPTEVSRGSSKKIYWECKKCGYEWEEPIKTKINRKSCPNCKK